MALKEQVSDVMFKLDIDNKTRLFLSISATGAVRRQGTGAEDCEDTRLFITMDKPEIFQKFIKGVREEVLEVPGFFVLGPTIGKPSSLQIAVKAGGRDIKYEFRFGTESEGPPEEICQLVERAVELSDDWFYEQAST